MSIVDEFLEQQEAPSPIESALMSIKLERIPLGSHTARHTIGRALVGVNPTRFAKNKVALNTAIDNIVKEYS